MNNITYLNILPDIVPPANGGQWEHIDSWGISIATTYNPAKDLLINWTDESATQCLISHLLSQDLVVTYNFNGFDKPLLSGFGNVEDVPAFGLMEQIQRDVGQRLRLQNLGRANGLDSTKVNLFDFLRSKPDEEQLAAYNKNKINTMSALIQRAVANGTLWYYGTGSDRSPRRFSTLKWESILSDHSRKF